MFGKNSPPVIDLIPNDPLLTHNLAGASASSTDVLTSVAPADLGDMIAQEEQGQDPEAVYEEVRRLVTSDAGHALVSQPAGAGAAGSDCVRHDDRGQRRLRAQRRDGRSDRLGSVG